MIVDLMRNDLSRVCAPGSVRASELFALERYATVHHLVSTVVGELAPGYDAFDLLRAAFPGGSITGAPKLRAMEIIAELEPSRRGVYCGSLGYWSTTGEMDTSIAIRTAVVRDGRIYFSAGGGIVADSDPEQEYRETLDKVRGHRSTPWRRAMILVLDNRDSFVYNLARYVRERGEEAVVRRSDELTLDDVAALAPSHIIISPGPCTPHEAGISTDVVRRFGPTTPILGVCLGHQCIGEAYGGDVVRAGRPMHGKTSRIDARRHRHLRGRAVAAARRALSLAGHRAAAACRRRCGWWPARSTTARSWPSCTASIRSWACSSIPNRPPRTTATRSSSASCTARRAPRRPAAARRRRQRRPRPPGVGHPRRRARPVRAAAGRAGALADDCRIDRDHRGSPTAR